VDATVAALPALHTLSLRRNTIGTAITPPPPQQQQQGRQQQPLARELFERTSVVVLNLEGNCIDKVALMEMAGVAAFMERRERAKDKGLKGGAMLTLSLCGLD
jgi:hypothetical protein